MKYKDIGFRKIYKHFVVVPITESLGSVLRGFPGGEEANFALTYGYIDSTCGLTLEVLAAAIEDGDSFRFAEENLDIRSIVRISAIENEDIFIIDDNGGELENRYRNRLERLEIYDVSDEIEKTREMEFLDPCRHECCIDDVLVYLIKDGNNPEGCWTRISGLGDSFIMGTLLNEPDQDYGYHEGEQIAFFVKETDDNKVFCYSDMNPSRRITAEDLEDGSVLEAAVAEFAKQRNEANFITVLELMRDSFVWVPCNAIVGDLNQEQLMKMLEGKADDLDSIVGTEFSLEEEVRLIPDILQNGDDFFFPVFTTQEAMGEYGEHFSKVQKHMLEVISLARNNEAELSGIVLNAFSEPFVLDAELWDMFENMKSLLQ